MLPAAKLPTYLIMYTVYVPVSQTENADSGYEDRAREIVARYLYGDAVVDRVELSDDYKNFLVVVRHESFAGANETSRCVEYQRGRLSSGLYASTEPVTFAAQGPRD